jgi:hypothetical protein
MAISTGSWELIKMMRERLPEDELRDRLDLMEEAAEFHQQEVLEWLNRDATIFEREHLAVFVLERKLADSLLIGLDNGFQPWWYRTREISLKWRASAKLEFVTAPEGFWWEGGWWTDASGATLPLPALGVPSGCEDAHMQTVRPLETFGVLSEFKGEWTAAMSQALLRKKTEAKSVVFTLGVTAVGKGALCGFEILESVVLPVSCASVGAHAFRGCKSLKTVRLPAGCKITGDNAFYGCSSLVSVMIPVGCEEISRGCFRWCMSLVSVKIPDGCSLVGNYAFDHCSLKEIIIPAGCRIGQCAFWGCRALVTVTICEGCGTICINAFSDCTALTKVAIGAGCTFIEGFAFSGCLALTTVTLPSTVKSIGTYCFGGCLALAMITLPKGCRLGDNALTGTMRVTYV